MGLKDNYSRIGQTSDALAKRRPRASNLRGRQRSKYAKKTFNPQSRSLLHANRYPVPQRQNSCENLRRLIHEFVELLNRFGVGVGIGLCDFSAPQDIVGDE